MILLFTVDACFYSLQVLSHTLTFVEEEVRNELPLQLAFLLSKGDVEFHSVVVDVLSDCVVPMCCGEFLFHCLKAG